MKLGLGLYRHMLTRENYRFARGCGATHVVVHLVDYFNQTAPSRGDNQPVGTRDGWGVAGGSDAWWTVEALTTLRHELNNEELELEAIENFDPVHWFDVLLDGPERDAQLEHLKTLIRNVGEAGIPILGYNFSLAGVAGRIKGPFARGGAESVGMDGVDTTPVPSGMVWNMVYDQDASPGVLPEIDHEELWRRVHGFLEAVLPVAEEAGVRLAAHPDDPPVPLLRRQPRLVYRPELFQRLVDLVPSPANALEFCLGTLTEMEGGDPYETITRHASQGNIAYVHFRNVRGKAPHYHETFPDEGDLDMPRVVDILTEHSFDGVLIPDHTPQPECGAPWHAGMAYALGYMRALLQRRAGSGATYPLRGSREA